MKLLFSMYAAQQRNSAQHWAVVVVAVVVGSILFLLLSARLRAQRFRLIAQKLGFKYLGRPFPKDLPLEEASFWEPFDVATNVMRGIFKDVDTIVLYFHANHGDVGYKQTIVAMKSDRPIHDEFPSLWITSEIKSERVGRWILLYRPKEVIPAKELSGFLEACWRVLARA